MFNRNSSKNQSALSLPSRHADGFVTAEAKGGWFGGMEKVS